MAPYSAPDSRMDKYLVVYGHSLVHRERDKLQLYALE